MNNKKKPFYRKKRYQIILAILVLLLVVRLYLPTLIKNYVNDVLADIPGYYGQVEDIDLALFRGAYVINGMYLNKVNAETEIPFLKFPENDISIEWSSLLRGKIVSEIEMYNPEVIYVFEDQQNETGSDSTEVEDWTKALTDIVPIDINHLEIHNGKAAFVELTADPNIDLHISNLDLTAENLRNVVAKDRTLPSPVVASGVSIGNGKFEVQGAINLIKQVPDIDLEWSLEDIDVTALNDFTQHYASIDFSSGKLNVFSEIAIADGYLKGYIKPLLSESKLFDKDERFLEKLWEGFVGFFKFVLKNQRTETLATKVPIEGDLKSVEAGFWTSIKRVFENAWFDAFKNVIDNEIEFKDAFQEKDP